MVKPNPKSFKPVSCSHPQFLNIVFLFSTVDLSWCTSTLSSTVFSGHKNFTLGLDFQHGSHMKRSLPSFLSIHYYKSQTQVSKGHYLSMQRILICDFIFRFIIKVMHRGGFALCGKVAFLKCSDSLLHVLLLGHGLHRALQRRKVSHYHGILQHT